MAQPPTYNRSFSFTNFQSANPSASLPGNSLDVELNNIKTTLDAFKANLALIQRDDTALANACVGLAQLSPAVTVGFSTPTAWVTAKSYVNSPASTVFSGGKFYSCLISHTSGTFATDLAALKWVLIADLTAIPLVAANQIAVTASGMLTTDVQGSLQALDAGKAASSHTHPSSAITDSTAAGRNFLTAADLPAQKTILGLGSLAYLNTVPVTVITANLAYTGVISGGTLSANTNDWTPTGWATCAVVKVAASSAVNLTGFAATSDGDVKTIQNTGSFAIAILFDSTSSAAANRVNGPVVPTGQGFVLLPGTAVTLQYDATASRWRTLSQPTQTAAQTTVSGFRNLKVLVTADNQALVTADAITLEDTSGNAIRLTGVSATLYNIAGNYGAANGLDTGVMAISTWYSVWLIYNPTTGVTATQMSLSATAPTPVSGYTYKVRVGWVRTDATAAPNCKFLRTIQYGRRAQYVVTGAAPSAAYPLIASGTAGTYSVTAPTWSSPIPLTAYVPSTASAVSLVAVATYNGLSSSNLNVSANSSCSGSNGVNPPIFSNSNTGATAFTSLQFSFVLETMNFYWASAAAGGAIFCAGWEDNL